MIRLKKLLEDIPMGTVAFGEDPEMAKYQNAPEEDNTAAETGLRKLLIKWYGGTPGATGTQGQWSGMISNELYDIKSDLLKLKKQFPKVFGTGDSKFAFRGSNTPNDYPDVYNLLKDASQIYIIEKHGKIHSEPVIAIPYTYKPKSLVQSWSATETVAETFANWGPRKIIMMTNVDDTFIMNPEVSNLLSVARESEMLHFGNDINCFLVISSNEADNIFAVLYEIVAGYKVGALYDSDEDMVKACFEHENFKNVCKVVSDYNALPWS
jgi:hypothetical protein